MKKTLGSRLYTYITNSMFWMSAAVSALLTIVVLTQIDPVNMFDCIIFGIISVIVEGNKIINILRRNIFSSLYKKLPTAHIKAKEIRFLTVYLAGAIFAVAITAGFSFKASSSSINETDTQIQIIETKIQNLDSAQNVYNSAVEKFNELDDAQTERDAKIKIAETQEEKKSITNRYREKLGNNDYNLSKAKKELSSSLTALNDAKTTAGASKADLLIQKQNLESEKIKTGGASVIFENYAGLIKMDTGKFKMILVIFLSILVELTIFISSPTMAIDSNILYMFKNDLPKDTDVDALIKDINKEMDVYSYASTTKMSSAEKRALKEKINEAKEKAYEEYDKKYEKIIDRNKRDYLEENGKYKNEIKILQAKLKMIDDAKEEEKIIKESEKNLGKLAKKENIELDNKPEEVIKDELSNLENCEEADANEDKDENKEIESSENDILRNTEIEETKEEDNNTEETKEEDNNTEEIDESRIVKPAEDELNDMIKQSEKEKHIKISI